MSDPVWACEDIPAFLRLTAEERRTGWLLPSPFTGRAIDESKPVDLERQAAEARIAEEKRIKTANRIARMKLFLDKHEGERWDARKGAWVPK
jgi:hypothetical protein